MININNNIESECYWCGAPATSREHVPPKCLFPELKDIASIYNDNFRKDLITVPSCYEHNLNKSKEDEILMACLAPIMEWLIFTRKLNCKELFLEIQVYVTLLLEY